MKVIDLIEIYTPLFFLIYSYLLNNHAKNKETKVKPEKLFTLRGIGLPLYEIRWDFLFVCISSLVIYSARIYYGHTQKNLAFAIIIASIVLVTITVFYTLYKSPKQKIKSIYVLWVSAVILMLHVIFLLAHLYAETGSKIFEWENMPWYDVLKLIACVFILVIVISLFYFKFFLEKFFFEPSPSSSLKENIDTYKRTPNNVSQKQHLLALIIEQYIELKDCDNAEKYFKEWDKLKVEPHRIKKYNSLQEELFSVKRRNECT